MSSAGLVIRPIAEGDAEATAALRRQALIDAPLAFAAAPESDGGSDPAVVRDRIAQGPANVSFGAFDAGRLVGMASVVREPSRKRAHRTNVFGMYVAASHRRRGVAWQLLEAAARHAEASGAEWLCLSVSSAAPAAQALYERFGFAAWGREEDALRDGGQSAAEVYMALALPRE